MISAYHALCNYVFLFHTSIFVYISYVNFFSHFTFDNDGMKSLKRQVTLYFYFVNLLVKMFTKTDYH